jgi:alkanesulfonate monooxygenase SsuD/methylene tetrahydromethanopterin reductase-like flavin-dependent oxidoreductase (luciferase family)
VKGQIGTEGPGVSVKAITDPKRAAWQAAGNAGATMPMMGVFRHVVVAESDAKALDIARAAYRPWRENMEFLWKWGGIEFPIGMIYPNDFDSLQAMGMGIAGAPETVRRYITSAVAQTGITYFVCDMSFGSIPFDAASRSVDMFAREIMPQFH